MTTIRVVEEKNTVDMTRPPYTLVLTHDIDVLSVSELPIIGRTLWGFIYRCLLANLRRLVTGRLSLQQYADSAKQILFLPLIRLECARDPWQDSLDAMLNVERRLGVRSTLFFISVSKQPGHTPDGRPAPRNRAAYYALDQLRGLLLRLEREGWEVGVHGIDAHLGVERARAELAVMKTVLPEKRRIGIRMHWLYLKGEESWKAFDDAGFAYDASFGWNDRVGFPDGRYHPFVPEGARVLVVLPLVIQDGALLGGRHQLASRIEAWQRVDEVLQLAQKQRAVVTVLWHNHSFVAPRYWGWLYERIIERARSDGALICRAIDVVEALARGEP